MTQHITTSIRRVLWICCWLGPLTGFHRLHSEEARVRAQWNGAAARVSVIGSAKEDWFLESATRLTDWVREPDAPPLASGSETGAPERAIPGAALAPQAFLRAVRTGGLFDDTFMRTFHLRFQQPN